VMLHSLIRHWVYLIAIDPETVRGCVPALLTPLLNQATPRCYRIRRQRLILLAGNTTRP
jgi:hypothetical protein